MNVRFTRVKLKAPVGKDYDSIEMYVISAKEESSRYVAEKDRVDWTLVTKMPIESFASAKEKIEGSRKRWNPEVCIPTLKSGFGVENTLLKDVKRIKKFIALTSLVDMEAILVIPSIQKCAKSKKQTLFYIKGTKGSSKIREQKRFKISNTRGNSRGVCKSICIAGMVYGKEIRSTDRARRYYGVQ